MLIYAFTFTVALLLSMAFTPVVKKLALRYRAMDKPNHRKVHDVQIPRLGGLAVYLSFMIVFYVSVWAGAYGDIQKTVFSSHFLRGFAVGSFVIVILGALDDLRELRAGLKLVLQVVAAFVVIGHGLVIKVITLPYLGDLDLGPLAIPFTLFWIVGITNAINLIDGLDGLAGGVTFIALMTLFLISLSQGKTEAALFSIVLAGSIVGFLRYNFNPAQIFLGDSGALFLGFSLAVFGIVGAMKSSTTIALLIPIVALGFPIMDTMLAMIRRVGRAMKEGKGPIASFKEIGVADKEHVHHKLLDLGYTHRKTVVLLYGICIIFGLFAFSLTAYRDQVAGTILFFVALIVFVMVRVLGYLEFRGLKEGNFLEQYISKLTSNIRNDVKEKSGKDEE